MAKVCRRTGKMNYRSENEARAALRRVAEAGSMKRQYTKAETDYYKCLFCPYYHLTSQEQRRTGTA